MNPTPSEVAAGSAPTAAAPEPAPPAAPVQAVVWLVLAGLLTLGLLPYLYGRVLVIGLATQAVEPGMAALLAAAAVGIALLARGLARAYPRPRTRWAVFGMLAGCWVIVYAALVAVKAGPRLPVPLVVALFVPATLWLLWATWMGFVPLGWPARLGVLGLGLAAFAGSVGVLTVRGVMGDTQVDFALRTRAAELEGGDTSGGAPADLAHPTDHDYPEFLGPQRQGVVPGARPAGDWRSRPPREVWRHPVGAGWGSFAVVGAYAVTQEQRGAEECVVCYRLADGGRVWTHADRAQFGSSMGGPGPRATPTVVGGRVYTVGATGILNCLDGATGRALWTVNILEDNHAGNIAHGVCGSPLVAGDRVIVSPTGAGGPSLAAYHRDTGRRLWQGGTDQASYSSPMPAVIGGVEQVLLFTSKGVDGHDPATGRVLWHFPWENNLGVSCSQPIPNAGAAGRVFISTDYGKGCALFRVRCSPAGEWSAEAVWEGQRHCLKTKFTTPVLFDGHVYGLDDGVLQCVDLATGGPRWRKGAYGHGQIMLAGDRLLVQAEDGAVVLVEPAPDGLRERGRVRALDGKTWNNPALAGRYLLVRNDAEAVCYELPPRGD